MRATTPMRRLLLVLTACSSSPSAPDAYQPPSNTPICDHVTMMASCASGDAAAEVDLTGLGGGSHSMCALVSKSFRACTTGCTTPVARQRMYAYSDRWGDDNLWTLANAAAALCAETPAAKPGDPCDHRSMDMDGAGSPHHPCLPTRADLGSDGSVVGQTYLACGPDDVCVAAPAPVVSNYLAPCAGYGETYGGSGVSGVVGFTGTSGGACLIAWDDAAQLSRTAQTIQCMGDWECPDGALCDGTLTPLGQPAVPVAVCKPGPRGTLTAAMLPPS